MENRRICSGLSGLCLLFASTVASAHELWLDSEKFQYEIGDKVEVSLINGTKFDGVKLPYFTRRVSELYYSIDTRVEATSRLGDLPAFQQMIDTAGLARFVYVSKIDNITYRGLKKFTAFVEEKDARVPGFGDRLYEFVTPLFADAEEDFQRIIRSACLLQDVSWRAHPDFRANLCFETATRSNLGGLKHWERVFLGVSLLHRYRNKRKGSPYSDLFPLLSDTQIEQAEILGKAMRIGAMLWVKDNKKRAALNWNETTRELVLELSQKNADLFGEVCAARLGSLASTLNASSRLLLV